MRAAKIKIGQRFWRLRVVGEVKKIGVRRAFKFKCDCGQTVIKPLITVTTGHTKSCGCLFVESLSNKRTHGRSLDPIYAVWRGMLDRCQNTNNGAYVNYGGRGIKICKRWLVFENFLADMGERPSPKHEITRKDNDGDYKPGNVEWSNDGYVQARNCRAQKGGTSKYRGVDWWNNQAWRARITIEGKVHEIGLFDTEKEAARARDSVARLHKGFILNFP